MRIETKQAPKPSQPEVVLSDGEFSLKFLFLHTRKNYLFQFSKNLKTVQERKKIPLKYTLQIFDLIFIGF